MTESELSARGARPGVREQNMSSKPKIESDKDMRPEYDFTGAVRGKYYERYRQGTNVVLLDPDVAAVFRDAAAVNDALRLLVSVAEAKVSRLPVGPESQERSSKRLQTAGQRKRRGAQRRVAKASRR